MSSIRRISSSCRSTINSINKRNVMPCNYSPAPPSAPRSLSVIFQDQSVIVVAWLAPSDSGERDDAVYDVSCFQCDAGPVCSNRKPCSRKLEYWPMKFNNPKLMWQWQHYNQTRHTSWGLLLRMEWVICMDLTLTETSLFETKLSGAAGAFFLSLSLLTLVSAFPLPLPFPFRSSHSPDLPLSRLPLSRPPPIPSSYSPSFLWFFLSFLPTSLIPLATASPWR